MEDEKVRFGSGKGNGNNLSQPGTLKGT